MRQRIAFGSILAVAFAVCPALSAQTIRGRVVDAVTKAAISGALAELRDAQGHVFGQSFTSVSGGFVFVTTPAQKYMLRIAAIGYARQAPVEVTSASDAVVIPDIALTAVVVTLPELHAMAGKRACGKAELTPETFGGLIESARTSLQVMDATLRSAQIGFEMQVIHRIAVRGTPDSVVSADTVGGMIREWPVRSLSLDSLQLFGYQRPKTEAEGFGHHYYGPDMAVLVSDWFLDTHCFTMDKDRSKGDTVVIRFDPTAYQR